MLVFTLVSILPPKNFIGNVYEIGIAATRGTVTLGFEVVSINEQDFYSSFSFS